jgi:DNA-binding response OmpR family regulator
VERILVHKSVTEGGNLLLDGAKVAAIERALEGLEQAIESAAQEGALRPILDSARESLTTLRRLLWPEIVELRLDASRTALMVNSAPIHLTDLEFRLIACLRSSLGRPVGKDKLLAASGKEASSIVTHVSHIRRKLRRATGRGDLIGYEEGRGWIARDSLDVIEVNAPPARWL